MVINNRTTLVDPNMCQILSSYNLFFRSNYGILVFMLAPSLYWSKKCEQSLTQNYDDPFLSLQEWLDALPSTKGKKEKEILWGKYEASIPFVCFTDVQRMLVYWICYVLFRSKTLGKNTLANLGHIWGHLNNTWNFLAYSFRPSTFSMWYLLSLLHIPLWNLLNMYKNIPQNYVIWHFCSPPSFHLVTLPPPKYVT
jgi:hypothetical protein